MATVISNLAARFRRPNRIGEPTKAEADTITTKDEEETAHEWDRPIEFVFSLISNSVGLGNVWRFPYLAAKNGGGAFLIPYFILYFLIGAPIYYLELALGQFGSRGPATAFVLARGWRGVGYAMIINSVLCMLYYNVIISWALFYFVLSFRKRLLWQDCGHWWNSVNCYTAGEFYKDQNATTFNCSETQYFSNVTNFFCIPTDLTNRTTATEEFYFRLLLRKSPSFEEFGTPQPYMSLALLVAWTVVCLCIIRGVKSSGKAAYFTAIFPYIVLLILVIQSGLLDGARDGILYYVVPKWELVGRFSTWQAAASQVFFSLGLSFGSLMAYSSSNKFNNNFFRQMCIVVSCDCLTGVFAGFAVFATIGFLAKELGESVEKYAAASGPGLAFITYPEAISHMPVSPFFAIIFFLMLLALGLGSQFALTDVPITSLIEIFPRLGKRRWLTVICTCLVAYLISLPFACQGGIYWYELLLEYAANLSMVVVGFFEVLVVAYIYGFNNFMNDVKMMLKKRAAEYYLFLTWRIAAPLLMLIIVISNLINSKPMMNPANGGFPDYYYPKWSTVLGWIIFAICVVPIPLFYLVNYIKQYRRITLEGLAQPIGQKTENHMVLGQNYTEKPRYLEAFTRNNSPDPRWGPKKRINHYGRYAHLNAAQPFSKEVKNPAFINDDQESSQHF